MKIEGKQTRTKAREGDLHLRSRPFAGRNSCVLTTCHLVD